jgi:prephenate dehydrogenase
VRSSEAAAAHERRTPIDRRPRVRIAVLGVGLIGGSVGLAARERVGAEVVGWDPGEGVLAAALERGAIDRAAPDAAAALAGAEAVFVAVPVGALPDAVRAALAAAGPDCVVTDVGSTKRAVVRAAADERFIGGHPLAGAETAGVRHARAELFEGATWYLTPTPQTRGTLYERLHRLLAALGARPAALDAETHDRVLAVVSHLPHVLANVLVAQAARALSEEGERLPATGPSFRDMTRVAGANTAMWRDIYLANADALVAVMDDTLARLTRVRAALAAGDGDAVAAWNDGAREERRRLLGAELAVSAVAELRVSVPNRPGVVAEVALALGQAGVNIVDMALAPAADNASGTISLWLDGEQQAATAEALVAGLGYGVARA